MFTNKLKITSAIRYFLLSCGTLLGLISIIATGGGDGSESIGDSGEAGTEIGTLSISMGDSVGDLHQVWVTIDEVSVHKSVDEENEGEEQGNIENEGEENGYWEVLEEANVGTYNLLELINGELVELVTGELEAAHYTQIRLLIGKEPFTSPFPVNHVPLWNEHPYANYVVTSAPEDEDNPDPDLAEELMIPSGFETGIKLTKGFEIEGGVVTELILDWDMDKSIHQTGPPGNGEYILRPTVKILEAVVASTLIGSVTKDDPAVEDPEVTIPVQGAVVTAQGVETESGEEVSVSTLTDENGNYMLTLMAGTYDIFVTTDGGCGGEITGLVIEEATDVTEGGDFLLDCSSTLSGTVSDDSDPSNPVVDATIEAFAYIDENTVSTEVYTSTITNENGDYTLTLGAGKYDIAATATVGDEGNECDVTAAITIDIEEATDITEGGDIILQSECPAS